MILMRLRTGLVRTHKQALHDDNSMTSGSRWLRLDPSLEQPASSDVNVCVSYGSVAYIICCVPITGCALGKRFKAHLMRQLAQAGVDHQSR